MLIPSGSLIVMVVKASATIKVKQDSCVQRLMEEFNELNEKDVSSLNGSFIILRWNWV